MQSSDLVLDADHSLEFLGTQKAQISRNIKGIVKEFKDMLVVSYLDLQVCISFCSVSD